MIRAWSALFGALLLMATDLFWAAVCLFLAYQLKTHPEALFDWREFISAGDFRPYVQLILVAMAIRLGCYLSFSAYRTPSREYHFMNDAIRLIKAISLGSALLIIVSYLGIIQYWDIFQQRDFTYSRSIFIVDWLLNILFVVGTHVFAGALRSDLRRKGLGLRRIAVQGTGETAVALIEEVLEFPQMGYAVEGVLDDTSEGASFRVNGTDIQRLGQTENILQAVNRHRFDEVVVTEPRELSTGIVRLVDDCHKVGVVVKLVPDLYGLLFRRSAVEELAGMPVVQINELGIVGISGVLKRMEDVAISAIALVVFSPFMLAATLAVRFGSPGPIFFVQQRIGRNGRHFGMFKFRSMFVDAEEQRAEVAKLNESDGPLFKVKDDPRITPVGKFLRRMSIDELPQLFNVLRGDMSLVGPRPLPVYDVESPDQWEQKRFSAVPGITGMWQVNRVAHTSEEMLKWDLFYIENWSLWLDIQILVKTVGVVLLGRGAY